jgi:hypothetical protein
MMPIIGIGQLGLIDLNDAIVSGTAPSNPSIGTLWVDETTSPNTIKRWSGTAWLVIGEIMDAGTGGTISDITETLGNMANDNILDVQERKVIKDKLTEIIGYVIADTATTLPTTSTLDSSAKGGFYSVRKSALNAGLSSSDSVYTTVATKYNDLKTYLEGLTPVDAWDVRNADSTITVVKSTFRDKWLQYYLAVDALATATAQKLKQNVDDVTVGGTNYGSNGDFSMALADSPWASAYGGSIKEIVDISSETPPFQFALHVKNTSATNGGIFSPTLFNGTVAEALVNKELTIQFWLKYQNIVQGTNTWNAGRFGEIIIEGETATGTKVYSYPKILDNGTHTTGTNMTWTKYTGTIKLSLPSSAVRITKISFKHGIEGATGEFWTTGLKIEGGNKVTDWTPNPLDMQGRVTTVESKVTPTAIINTVSASEKWLIMEDDIDSATNKIEALTINPAQTTLIPFDSGFGSTNGIEPMQNPIATLRRREGKFGGAIAVEKGTTNMFDSESTGSQNWESWNHYGNATYWNQEASGVMEDDQMGRVFWGRRGTSTVAYLYKYYPFTYTLNGKYTNSIYLKVSRNLPDHSFNSYINSNVGGQHNIADSVYFTGLTTEWQRFEATHTVTEAQTATGGMGWQLGNLPEDVILYACMPQLEASDFATSYVQGTRDGGGVALYQPDALRMSPTEGTIAFWATDPKSTGTRALASWGDYADNRTQIYKSGNTLYIWTNAGSNTATKTWNGFAHFAFTWKTGEMKLYMDGELIITRTESLNVGAFEYFAIGNRNLISGGWSAPANALFDDLRIDKIARTPEEIKSWYQLDRPFIDITSYENTKETLNLVKTKLEGVEQSITSQGITTIITSSTFYDNYVQDLGGKADADVVGNMVDLETYNEFVNGIDGKIGTAIGNIDFSPYATSQYVDETSRNLTRKFSASGGMNLLRNSIGFSDLVTQADVDADPTIRNWFVTHAGAGNNRVSRVQTTALDTLGFGSGFQVKAGASADVVVLNQYVNVVPDQVYTLSWYIDKNNNSPADGQVVLYAYEDGGMTTTVKILDPESTAEDPFTLSNYTYTSTETTDGFEVQHVVMRPTTSRIRIRIYGYGLADFTISGLMFTIGDVPLQWSLATGENYNTNVRLDINGIRVSQLDANKTEIGYTQITPDEFAGYYSSNGGQSFDKVFYLNGEETVTKKIRALDEITMGTIKIIKVPSVDGATSPYTGWAFVPVTDE